MPRWQCVGEDAEEGLLGVEEPSEGNENGLEELGPIEVTNAVFYCGVKRREKVFVLG